MEKKSENKKKISKNELKEIFHILRGAGFADFLRYLQSPWRIFLVNFFAGIFRGLGILIGMTVVVAVLVWFLTKMVDFPLIGEYFQKLLEMIESFSPQQNNFLR